MEELIKKIAEAFRDYVLNSDAFKQAVTEVAKSVDHDVRFTPEFIREAMSEGLSERVADLVGERLDTSNVPSLSDVEELIDKKLEDAEIDDQRIRDVVRCMDFTIEVGRY